MNARIDRIMEIMRSAFDPCWGEAWNHKQVQDALHTANTYCILGDPAGVIDHDERPAAGFLLSRAAPGEEELLLLGVTPAYRRSGVARLLVEQFKQAARTRGAERLFLEMRENNPAREFYVACQFFPIGRRRAYYRQSDGTYLDAITFAHVLE